MEIDSRKLCILIGRSEQIWTILKIISTDARNVYVWFFDANETIALRIGTSQVFQCVAVMWSFYCPKTTQKKSFIVHSTTESLKTASSLRSCTNLLHKWATPSVSSMPLSCESFSRLNSRIILNWQPNQKSPGRLISCSACHRTFGDNWTNFWFHV